MAIYATSDLHLSLQSDKPMEKFGNIWENYLEKIEINWKSKVKADDVVLIVGDISWALNLEDSLLDLKFIDSMPGIKYIVKGNHDYWWATKSKMNKFFNDNNIKSIKVVSNDIFDIDKYILCGTRGWGKTMNNIDKSDDEKIYRRECIRLENMLKEVAQRNESSKNILVAMHFPPYLYQPFEDILVKYKVKKCIYGHLHGVGQNMVKEGIRRGIEYKMVSCDYNNFEVVEI